jgi:hypothetical protein
MSLILCQNETMIRYIKNLFRKRNHNKVTKSMSYDAQVSIRNKMENVEDIITHIYDNIFNEVQDSFYWRDNEKDNKRN